jgi:hypothetical protein
VTEMGLIDEKTEGLKSRETVSFQVPKQLTNPATISTEDSFSLKRVNC